MPHPEGQVEDILALFEIFRAGYASAVLPTVVEVLGRAPRSLATFVHDYRSASPSLPDGQTVIPGELMVCPDR